MKHFFLTGTGTDIGKTYVAGCLARQICLQDPSSLLYVKPIASGVTIKNVDVENVRKQIRGLPNGSVEGWYSFREPASPYIAGNLEGKVVPYSHMLRRLQKIKAADSCHVLVEGAGGLMVPITKKKTMLDLTVDWGSPVILVGQLGLGTVNHTCLSIELLQQRGCSITGFILNQTQNKKRLSVAEKSNADEIMRLTGVPCLGVIRFGMKAQDPIFRTIVQKLLQS